jgi:hypothetical protein
MKKRHVNDREPNFHAGGTFFLVRCFSCGGERGKENWAPAVAGGRCTWCGWEPPTNKENEGEEV